MSVRLRWLGQAGFLAGAGPAGDGAPGDTAHLLIDPYLSDSLARKYAGSLFPHRRMQPPPLTVADLPPLSGVLCTHAHTDHMDHETLTPLLAAQPDSPLVAPRAVLGEALRRADVTVERVRPLGDGDEVALPPFAVRAVASAHEERTRDDHGDDLYLGYVIVAGGVRLYHSGDCAPYPGLAATLAALDIDVALLPVNGRDRYRRENGVPGNFTFDEATDLCAAAGIPALVPHHWGMFDFNTADPAGFDLSRAGDLGVRVLVPVPGAWFDPTGSGAPAHAGPGIPS